MTEQLHFHFSLSCLGEGNGNPLADGFNLGLRAQELPGCMKKATLEVMAGKESGS